MWVKAEMNIAFEEQKVLIPFRMDETPLKGQNRLILNHKHWIDAYPDYKMKIDDLVIAVLRALGRPVADEEPEQEEDVVSYREAEDVVVKNIVVAGEPTPRVGVKQQQAPVKSAPKRRGWIVALVSVLLLVAGVVAVALLNDRNETSTESSQGKGKYSFASERKLTAKELRNYSLNELKIMRNEIYARHGYIFASNGEMRDYFEKQDWYTPSTYDVTSKLNSIEQYNISIIKDFEKRY
jgi:hypothetical protein